jgi:hypothetical protein
MNNIGHEYDFDDQFFRMITVSLAKTLSKNVRWINKFSPEDDTKTGFYRVFLPFYTSLTGDERFVLDAFVDDIADKRVTMNTDQLQRGTITWVGISSRSDEFSNPNQYLSKNTMINKHYRKVISKAKGVPISCNYDIEIQLATSNEVDKVSQKLLNVFYNYMFFNFDYCGLKIDAFFNLPDDKQIEIGREINMESDRKKKITFSLEIQTYYPIFMIDTDDLIVCDNDDDIDWDNLNIPRPTFNHNQNIKNYNESYGQMAYSGGTDSEEYFNLEGQTEIRKVYWENMYKDMVQKIENDSNIKKETFIGVDPGKSSRNKNDIDE